VKDNPVHQNLASLNEIMAEVVKAVSADPSFVTETRSVLRNHSHAIGFEFQGQRPSAFMPDPEHNAPAMEPHRRFVVNQEDVEEEVAYPDAEMIASLDETTKLHQQARRWNNAVSPLRDIVEEMIEACDAPVFQVSVDDLRDWYQRITGIVG